MIGSCSVTALAVEKAPLLGDMPKRHVGYALTLSGIFGLMIARIGYVLLNFKTAMKGVESKLKPK